MNGQDPGNSLEAPPYRNLPVVTHGKGSRILGYATVPEAIEPLIRPVCFEPGCTYRREEHPGDEGHLFTGLDPRIFHVSPTGHRCIVVRATVEAMYEGLIHKPPGAREQEQMEIGAGWIVSVGANFNGEGSPHPSGPSFEHPTDAIGLYIYFQRHVGKPFLSLHSHGEWNSPYVYMTDRDLLGIDFDRKTYDTETSHG